ncbi:MAG: hypothetical protein ABJC26_07455 [Gemmatimonadaceae bacterium]
MNGSDFDPNYLGEANDSEGRAQVPEWASAASATDGARDLLENVDSLSSRIRVNTRKAQSVDRRATAYASRLARHTARLLAHMPDAVPAIRPVRGTGASTLHHYVLHHQQLENPSRLRMLVVSSDGRLRLCTVVVGKQSRLWADYEVTNPPAGMGLANVFEGLSSLIARLEGGVAEAEEQTERQSQAVDELITESEAVLANAGSRLAPVTSEAELPIDVEEIFGGVFGGDDQPLNNGELTSHGFEQRITWDRKK